MSFIFEDCNCEDIWVQSGSSYSNEPMCFKTVPKTMLFKNRLIKSNPSVPHFGSRSDLDDIIDWIFENGGLVDGVGNIFRQPYGNFVKKFSFYNYEPTKYMTVEQLDVDKFKLEIKKCNYSSNCYYRRNPYLLRQSIYIWVRENGGKFKMINNKNCSIGTKTLVESVNFIEFVKVFGLNCRW